VLYFFTLAFSFINVRKIGLAIQVIRGKYDGMDVHDPINDDKVAVNAVDGDIVQTIKPENQHGEVNHFQALATAVSGTVGLGNIAGVAAAIGIGGPGATFWMIICGLLGMSSKFVECTLGVKYRDIDENGVVYGGPMYYLSRGLSEIGKATLGKIFGVLFRGTLCRRFFWRRECISIQSSYGTNSIFFKVRKWQFWFLDRINFSFFNRNCHHRRN
jgi:alanine or glycine:cation symporter, AGCS family